MEKIIIIKYGELSTKKDNKNFFISKLKNNIDVTLKNIEHETFYDFGRMFIKTNYIDEVINLLKNVFGIQEIMIGYKSSNLDIEDIKNNVLDLIKDKEFKTFKVVTKRSNKSYPLESMMVNNILGGHILKNIGGIHVDVHNPEIVVNVEIRNEEVLFYFSSIKGLGGYPVGTLGKGLLMLSGGIDSPVAGYLAIKRGVKLETIYFESPPHTSDMAKDKVIKLAKVLAKYNTEVKIHVINFTEIQESILKNIPHEYLITIMRRMMYRISAIVATQNNANIIVNGESIGQVASQTLTSMRAINEVVKIPVIRPVACFDKLEIIDISKQIGAYDISILPFEDCCTVFVPKHPVINPNPILCSEYEELITYKDLIYKAIKHHEVIKVSITDDNKYSDLL